MRHWVLLHYIATSCIQWAFTATSHIWEKSWLSCVEEKTHAVYLLSDNILLQQHPFCTSTQYCHLKKNLIKNKKYFRWSESICFDRTILGQDNFASISVWFLFNIFTVFLFSKLWFSCFLRFIAKCSIPRFILRSQDVSVGDHLHNFTLPLILDPHG